MFEENYDKMMNILIWTLFSCLVIWGLVILYMVDYLDRRLKTLEEQIAKKK